jgi:hypothetical protein
LADSEHVEVLRRGPRSWNDWRRQNPTTVPNLIRLFLSAAERQLGTMNGGPVNLASARLRRCCFDSLAVVRNEKMVTANISPPSSSSSLSST